MTYKTKFISTAEYTGIVKKNCFPNELKAHILKNFLNILFQCHIPRLRISELAG